MKTRMSLAINFIQKGRKFNMSGKVGKVTSNRGNDNVVHFTIKVIFTDSFPVTL